MTAPQNVVVNRLALCPKSWSNGQCQNLFIGLLVAIVTSVVGLTATAILVHASTRRRRLAAEKMEREAENRILQLTDDLSGKANVARWSTQRVIAEEGKEAWRKWRTSHYLPKSEDVPLEPAPSAAPPATTQRSGEWNAQRSSMLGPPLPAMAVGANNANPNGGGYGFHLPRPPAGTLRLHTGNSSGLVSKLDKGGMSAGGESYGQSHGPTQTSTKRLSLLVIPNVPQSSQAPMAGDSRRKSNFWDAKNGKSTRRSDDFEMMRPLDETSTTVA